MSKLPVRILFNTKTSAYLTHCKSYRQLSSFLKPYRAIYSLYMLVKIHRTYL